MTEAARYGLGVTDPAGSTCESCGTETTELATVRRVYVTPEAWDRPGEVRGGDLERWCDVCRTHYPHQPPEEPVARSD